MDVQRGMDVYTGSVGEAKLDAIIPYAKLTAGICIKTTESRDGAEEPGYVGCVVMGTTYCFGAGVIGGRRIG